MGFGPTMVLNGAFDTSEKKRFARRLTTGFFVKDQRLCGAKLKKPDSIWHLNADEGSCSVIPCEGVVLILTNEEGDETVFGFLRYPDLVCGINGEVLAETRLGRSWHFRNFLKSRDGRYREIVRLFMEQGYLEEESDEYSKEGYVYIPFCEHEARRNIDATLDRSLEQMGKTEFLRAYCSVAYLHPDFHPDDWKGWKGPQGARRIVAEVWRRAQADELGDNEIYPWQATKAAVIHKNLGR